VKCVVHATSPDGHVYTWNEHRPKEIKSLKFHRDHALEWGSAELTITKIEVAK
jgi:hypothetical protein